MRAYIKKLQSKPEATRKQIAVVSVAVCMALVSLVWFYSLGDRFSTDSTNVAVNTDSGNPNPQESPFALFTDSVKSAYHNIAASAGGISFSNKNQTTKTQTNDNGSGKQIDLIVVQPKN